MYINSKIQHAFNESSISYDSVAEMQKRAAHFLVHKLLECYTGNLPQTILDLGSGTGYVPEILHSAYPNSLYILNDISPNMLKICEDKILTQHPEMNYQLLPGDMEYMDLPSADLVISNFALQWVRDLPKVLSKLYATSQKLFAFSTLIDGTFQEWYTMLSGGEYIQSNVYPTSTDLINHCKSVLIQSNALSNLPISSFFWIERWPISFANPMKFLQYLRLLGARVMPNGQQLMKFSIMKDLVMRQDSQKMSTSYNILFGVMIK